MSANQPQGRDTSGQNTVSGVFHDRATAERVASDLREQGFRSEDISVSVPERVEHAKTKEKSGNLALEIALPVAIAGGLFGGLFGFFSGLGPMNIGAVPAGGSGLITYALGGLGAGAVIGGLVGALAGIGISSGSGHDDSGSHDGGTTVTVRAGTDRAGEARGVLQRHGAAVS